MITGSRAHRSPYFNMVEFDPHGTLGLCKKLKNRIVRRQDSPVCYDLNASIYVWHRKALLLKDDIFHADTKIYEMPEERSRDIDSQFDFDLVCWLFKRGKRH